MIDAALFAIKKINDEGGILGRPLQPVIYDGASNEHVFAVGARELLEKDRVVAIFGCMASNCRKRVKPIVEEHNSVLFYPMTYEGLEVSPNIIYMGATPNQKVLPVVKWSFDNIGKRFYLMGTDTLYSNAMHAIVRLHIQALGGEVVGDAQFPVNNPPELTEIARDITEKRPDVIMSNLGRTSCESFLSQLQQFGINARNTPIFLFGLSTYKLYALDHELIEGAYSSWSYDEAIDSPESQSFKKAFRFYYGKGRAVDEPMETAYVSVLLWAKAANGLKTLDPETIIREIHRFSIQGPSGPVYVSEYNHHAFRRVRIGQIMRDGAYAVSWDSHIPLEPDAFPMFRTKQEWEAFLLESEGGEFMPAL